MCWRGLFGNILCSSWQLRCPCVQPSFLCLLFWSFRMLSQHMHMHMHKEAFWQPTGWIGSLWRRAENENWHRKHTRDNGSFVIHGGAREGLYPSQRRQLRCHDCCIWAGDCFKNIRKWSYGITWRNWFFARLPYLFFPQLWFRWPSPELFAMSLVDSMQLGNTCGASTNHGSLSPSSRYNKRTYWKTHRMKRYQDYTSRISQL